VNAVFDQLYSCLDHERIRNAVARQVGEAQPSAWFIAQFLMTGDGPDSPDDDLGWEDVADGLLEFIGFDEIDNLVAEVVFGLALPDPLEIVPDALIEPGPLVPGMYGGHPLWAYDETVRELKKSGRLEECDLLLVGLIESLEAYAEKSGNSLSPRYHEQLAIVRRKRKDAEGEVAVLERYFAHPDCLPSQPLLDRLEKARARLEA
jgi:hypothetical protein